MIARDMLRTAVVLLTIAVLSNCQRQSRQIIRNYQYETVYPASRNYLGGTYRLDRHPIKTSTSFNVKPLQLRLPHSPSPYNDIAEKSRIPAFIPANLFTPNTIEQPAETEGQIDEYRKALEEEEREMRGEQSTESSLGGATEASTNFVRVKSKEYNYNYKLGN